LDSGFGDAVELGCGFVEEEDVGSAHEGAGDGQALAFPAGEAGAANRGVESFREPTDFFVEADCPEGVPDFVVAGIHYSEQHVVANGAVDDGGFLFDVGDVGADVVKAEVVVGDAVHFHGAALGVNEAEQQGEDGGLACAGWSNECDVPGSRHVHADVSEGGSLGVGVSGGDIAQGEHGVLRWVF